MFVGNSDLTRKKWHKKPALLLLLLLRRLSQTRCMHADTEAFVFIQNVRQLISSLQSAVQTMGLSAVKEVAFNHTTVRVVGCIGGGGQRVAQLKALLN